MSKLMFFVISCSSDCFEPDARSLYVWGESETAKFLPDTKKEAMRRVKQCKLKNKCGNCDADIHAAEVVRLKR